MASFDYDVIVIGSGFGGSVAALRAVRALAVFAAAGGRTVRARQTLPTRPPDGAAVGQWPVRVTDFDVLGHVNNAIYWAMLEELLAARRDLRAPMTIVLEHHAVVVDALAQHGHPRGEVGRADVGDQAGLEALAQPLLQRGEVARHAVRGQDDLAAGVVQRVEGVEELLLGPGLGLEELDVVDEQDVDAAEALLEAVDVAAVQGAEERVGERLSRGAADGRPASVGAHVVADPAGLRASVAGVEDETHRAAN